jgi:hypothetical protein
LNRILDEAALHEETDRDFHRFRNPHRFSWDLADGTLFVSDIGMSNMAFRGKFVFGDINRGRVFAADVAALKAADDDVPRTVAPIEEIELLVRQSDGTMAPTTFKALVEKTMGGSLVRADLHVHRGADGELFLSSRQDGWIRTLAAADPPARPSAQR